MNIEEILSLTAEKDKNALLKSLLSHAFETKDGQLDFGQEIAAGEFAEVFSSYAPALLEKAEANAAAVHRTLAGELDEEDIKNRVSALFADAGDDMIECGLEKQIRLLIVSEYETPEVILGIMEDEAGHKI